MGGRVGIVSLLPHPFDRSTQAYTALPPVAQGNEGAHNNASRNRGMRFPSSTGSSAISPRRDGSRETPRTMPCPLHPPRDGYAAGTRWRRQKRDTSSRSPRSSAAHEVSKVSCRRFLWSRCCLRPIRRRW